MSDFWSGVFTGIATSSVVAAVVYWKQKRESEHSTSHLSNKITGTTAIAREALRTTIAIQDATNDIHRAVLNGQLSAALDPATETVRASHQAAASGFLKRANLDELRKLHTTIAGDDIAYSGLLRDAEAVVSGNTSPALVPAQSSEIAELLSSWLERVSEFMAAGSIDTHDGFRRIAELHAELMHIHPFFDKNGLIGRVLVAAMSEQVLGVNCKIPREDPEYFACLRAALAGQVDLLAGYLSARTAA